MIHFEFFTCLNVLSSLDIVKFEKLVMASLAEAAFLGITASPLLIPGAACNN